MCRSAFFVALVVALFLILRSAPSGLAAATLDPVGHIVAQDEALYASTAIHMAEFGGWLTPMFMGRPALYKPPLLPWLASLSARLFGVSRFTLRLPAVLLCALSAGLIFLWVAELNSWQAGLCAVALLATSRLWCILGSACMTDGLLAAFFTIAMYCLFSDPWLESRRAFWGFSLSVAASIVTKSIAGALPLVVLGLYWLIASRKQKPALTRVCAAVALAAAVAAPWFLYQLAAHSRWFWTEHVSVEILGFGAGAPPQTSQENRFAFYLLRLPLTDPVLIALAITAAPAFFTALRKRSMEAALLACWIAVVFASVFAWQYRNVTYLLPLFPALAILSLAYGPFADMRPRWWMLPLLAAAIALKFAAPESPWGVPYRAADVPVAPALSGYCGLHRGNELVEVDPVDELFATDLPLPRVHYAWSGTPPDASPYALDFAGMGIILTAAQFNHLANWRPNFIRSLRAWGADSPEAIGTVIYYQSADDVAAMVHAHPDSDFLLPDRYQTLTSPDHVAAAAGAGHFLLLARSTLAAPPPKWTCAP